MYIYIYIYIYIYMYNILKYFKVFFQLNSVITCYVCVQLIKFIYIYIYIYLYIFCVE